MADTMLDIVNENDEVIGQALRSEIHAKGLLHREIHVWFITLDKQVIFQKRSMAKETNPGLLTTAVAGHVELGAAYNDTAIIETFEETGLKVSSEKMLYFDKYFHDSYQSSTQVHNRSIRALFGMVYEDIVTNLEVEQGDGTGFVAIPFADLIAPNRDLFKQISPGLLEDEFPIIKDQLLKLVV